MYIKNKNQIFNLSDTNGRRFDVINSYVVYLNILKNIYEQNPGDVWSSFPKSLSQYKFYKEAINSSPDVFKLHPKFDLIDEKIGQLVECNDINQIEKILNENQLKKSLDKDVEQRARHYTNCLLKMGFVDKNRIITNVGESILTNEIYRDKIEKILPLKNENLILLRQILKLKIFAIGEEPNKLNYYSPFYFALYLIQLNKNITKEQLRYIVQLANPFISLETQRQLFSATSFDEMIELLLKKDYEIPQDFLTKDKISFSIFKSKITNQKSTNTVKIYYEFYSKLFDFVSNQTDRTFSEMKDFYNKNKNIIKTAFFKGSFEFDFGYLNSYNLVEFREKNKWFYCSWLEDLNKQIYLAYIKSKIIDDAKEYSDTTLRIFSATGIFRFNTALPQINFKSLLSLLFPKDKIQNKIFGSMSIDDYNRDYQQSDCMFENNITISQIENYSESDIDIIIQQASALYKTDQSNILSVIQNESSNDFISFIRKNFDREKIVSLLKLFSNRKNDQKIKNIFNNSSDVPTIFEYAVAIAWYWISNEKINLFESLNLTLNGDYEPTSHATGGKPDIEIDYKNNSIIVEATLMNPNAQKRGEWEPVLRHSINNKNSHKDKKCFTFFVADELDKNTINIWRAVATVPLEATNSKGERILGVTIMPIKNQELIKFVIDKINLDNMISLVEESFSNVELSISDQWREDIISKI